MQSTHEVKASCIEMGMNLALEVHARLYACGVFPSWLDPPIYQPAGAPLLLLFGYLTSLWQEHGLPCATYSVDRHSDKEAGQANLCSCRGLVEQHEEKEKRSIL